MSLSTHQSNNKNATAENATAKNVFFFAPGESEGNATMRNLLGGKGANLAEMTSLGVPVPPGFTISTQVCSVFYDNGEQLPDELRNNIEAALKKVEEKLDKKFGDKENPLLVSVRSGARVSMPGMMDTILNLGLNEETVLGLAKQSGSPRFAWDSYRRFVQMYSNVVMGMNHSYLEMTLEDLKDDKGYKADTDLTEDDLKSLVEKYKKLIIENTGKSFPENPIDQLWGAIEAVFQSWNTPRAKTYREIHKIPADWGTAVNIQSMVFGNLGKTSATGVAFTRNPSTGENKFYGEFLINAQGEDVVAGIRTPETIEKLKAHLPTAYDQLVDVYQKLEGHYRDMQDIEFTIENERLWMLQTRTGKRTAQAALKICCDMLDEGIISEEEALLRMDPLSLDQLLHPTLDPKAKKTKIAKGLPASPGGAMGKVVFNSEDAVSSKEKGVATILVRVETSPEDIEGMVTAKGILTSRGGMTSHAAVVARGMGKCCVAGCAEVTVDYKKKQFEANGYVIKEGDFITLDGSTGEVFLGEVPMVEPKLDGNFDRLMVLADRYRTLGIRTNADTPKDAKKAKEFGAEGIGLCRTEHMFFGADRIDSVREMILAENKTERLNALSKLLPFQKKDFAGLFEVMGEHPVTIRLLDPPLHEFLPHTQSEKEGLAQRLEWSVERLDAKINALSEFNPMLGHRGCRLAISYPEIYEMQAKAIAEAAVERVKLGQLLKPEIMIPLVGTAGELKILRTLVEKTVNDVIEQSNTKFEYIIGTMIELPRAALVADEIAEHADFFSFGTNDLTQTTLGLSRDDSGRFLSTYVAEGLLEADPFQSLDKKGVGRLVKMAVGLGRERKPDIKLGICGEHGGDPKSIEFFQGVGLDYVSCSPYRVPIARLAAAQSALQHRSLKT